MLFLHCQNNCTRLNIHISLLCLRLDCKKDSNDGESLTILIVQNQESCMKINKKSQFKFY